MLIFKKDTNLERLGLVNGEVKTVIENHYLFAAEEPKEEPSVTKYIEDALALDIIVSERDCGVWEFTTQTEKEDEQMQNIIKLALLNEYEKGE